MKPWQMTKMQFAAYIRTEPNDPEIISFMKKNNSFSQYPKSMSDIIIFHAAFLKQMLVSGKSLPEFLFVYQNFPELKDWVPKNITSKKDDLQSASLIVNFGDKDKCLLKTETGDTIRPSSYEAGLHYLMCDILGSTYRPNVTAKGKIAQELKK